MKVEFSKPNGRELLNLKKSAEDIFLIIDLIGDEEEFFSTLYASCISECPKLIYNKVKEINIKTDHTVSWIDIYNTLMEKYEFYLRNNLTTDTLMQLMRYHCLEEENHVYLGRMHLIDDETIYYEYEIEGEEGGSYFEELVSVESYMEEEITVKEAKKKYMKYHLQNNLGAFRTWYFTGKIVQYIHMKQMPLTDIQVYHALTLTVDKVYEKFESKNTKIDILEMIKTKITCKKGGRNQQIESFRKLSRNAYVDYVSEDENNEYFFPLIANILYHGLSTQKIVHKHKSLTKKMRELKYETDRLNYDLLHFTGEYKNLIPYLLLINEKPVWHYVMTVYAKLYRADYEDMYKLVKFLIYKNQNNHNNYNSPMAILLSEIVEVNVFSEEVI